ncbi:MAG: hypothetical protein IJ524_03510 [Bacteroidales bacterium]|nr:hypothetical protein [Bacteroidales bacterium]
MKNPEIEQLLTRYREGSLSDSELAELNRLTGRDTLMDNACRRADGIIRRRRASLFTVAGLLVAGATTWTLLNPQHSEATMVAEAVVPEVVLPAAPEPAVEQAAQVKATEHKPVATTQPRRTDTQPLPAMADEPVVVCNNQCEADSVISDIWKFLTV